MVATSGLDLAAVEATLGGLRTFPSAVTTVADGRANGCIVLSAGPASVVHEAPRVMVGLTKHNLTHDLVARGGVFTVHMLATEPDTALGCSLSIIQGLAGSSGRDGDKLSAFPTKIGVTGAPILLDALTYVEGRVIASLDADENTIFVADVVAAERLRAGRRLTIGTAWANIAPEWIAAYERDHELQVASARRHRGLPSTGL